MIRERYPDADILEQRGHWDDATRRVVLDRVRNVPSFKYFDGHRRRTLETLCARVVPQEQHPPQRRVPIAPWIDQRCASESTEGFRFDDMPPVGEAWRRGLDGLDETAQALYAGRFVDLEGWQQDEVLRSIRRGDPPGDIWRELPARRWWIQLALREITGVYYSHPTAWDEIGYGGPAYPRGYAALNHGAREPWEAEEDEAARRADEAERIRVAALGDALAGVPGSRAAHLQALATTALDGTGVRPNEATREGRAELAARRAGPGSEAAPDGGAHR